MLRRPYAINLETPSRKSKRHCRHCGSTKPPVFYCPDCGTVEEPRKRKKAKPPITPERADAVRAAGADSLAVITDFFTHADPEARVRQWLTWAARSRK